MTDFWIVVVEIAKVINALGVVAIGVLTFFVARGQWLTARTKLNIDLYERRLPVFNAARDFLSAIPSTRPEADEKYFQFVRETLNATYLFDQSIADYMRELGDRYFSMTMVSWRRVTAIDPDEKAAAEASWLEGMRWLQGEYSELEKRFEPYLTIEPHRGSRRRDPPKKR